VITPALAQRLRDAGIGWKPVNGDRFMVPDRELDDAVFVVSDMVVEAHDLPSGALLRFNGTTEWALDSLPQDETLWLPREDQLRALLGTAFVSLEVVKDGFVVVSEQDGLRSRHGDADAECAYAVAVLAHREGVPS
jgi:hypothetical protein